MYAAATVGRLIHPVAGAVGEEGEPRDSFREAVASEDLLAALGAEAGDWLHVSRQGLAGDGDEPWILRLVEAGQATVCPLPSRKAGPPALFLPSGVLEGLRATPGRTVVAVRRREAAEGVVQEAGHLVLSRVHAPEAGRRRYEGALKSFFSVPRVLRQGEIFTVPLHGLSRCLRDLEGGEGPCALPEEAEGSDEEGSGGVWRSAVSCGDRDGLDPICGLAFTGLLCFRVRSLEPAAASGGPPGGGSRCYRVDRRHTEVQVQGSCHSRALPYAASHHLCIAPPPLPATLREPFERLLGALAPAVRSWSQPRPDASGPEAPYAVLVAGARGCGKRLLWHAVSDRLGLHLLEANCHHLVAQAPGAAEEAVQKLVATAAGSSPVVVCLRRVQALAAGGPSMSPAAQLLLHRRIEGAISTALARMHEGHPPEQRPLVVLAGTCEDIDDVAGPLRKVFQVELELKRPNEEARREALVQMLTACGNDEEASPVGDEPSPLVAAIAKLSAGLSYADLRSVASEVALCGCLHPGRSAEERAEQAVKRIQGGSKVAVTLASKVQWADVGGLQDAKDEVMNCITLPLTSGQMFEGQKLRSGILLFGPPGTGKTLLAKAVATECRVHFLSVKGPELLSMYIGESEKNVRSLFQNARELAPCVLFFDELDSLAPARGRGSDSGGVMDRVVSQLLTELDDTPATVFLIGATNRPDLLDSSLLRPGRLDRMVYLGVAKDKVPLLKAVTRKFDLVDEAAGEAAEGDLLQAVANACPPNLTGADVSVLCADAYTIAQKDVIDLLHDIATRVHTSISTLLLFLEAVEKEPQEDGPGWADAFSLIFPQAGGGAQEVPTGLLLFRCEQQPGAFVLAHRLAAPGGGTSSGRVDSDAAVIFESGSAPGGRSPAAASIAAATADGKLERSWAEFWHATPARRGGFSSRLAMGTAGGGAAGTAACAGVVHGLSPLTALHVKVGRRHFQEALRNLQPSVPMEDLQRYEALGREHQNTKK